MNLVTSVCTKLLLNIQQAQNNFSQIRGLTRKELRPRIVQNVETQKKIDFRFRFFAIAAMISTTKSLFFPVILDELTSCLTV